MLLQKLAVIHEGQRYIDTPIALVLSKWDKMGNISYNPGQEKERALAYIEEQDWLRTLCQHLRTCCCYFEVFPVFSFIGDSPQPAQMEPFNVYAPLIWVADMADHNLLARCQRFQERYPDQFPMIIENYWGLLHHEDVQGP